MSRIVDSIYTFKGKVEDVENDYIIKVQEKLKSMEDKEEQGLLIELPVPFGTKVYVLDYRAIRKGEIERALFYDKGVMIYEGFTYDIPARLFRLFPQDIGKTVFLTEAEAEEALAKMGGK